MKTKGKKSEPVTPDTTEEVTPDTTPEAATAAEETAPSAPDGTEEATPDTTPEAATAAEETAPTAPDTTEEVTPSATDTTDPAADDTAEETATDTTDPAAEVDTGGKSSVTRARVAPAVGILVTVGLITAGLIGVNMYQQNQRNEEYPQVIKNIENLNADTTQVITAIDEAIKNHTTAVTDATALKDEISALLESVTPYTTEEARKAATEALTTYASSIPKVAANNIQVPRFNLADSTGQVTVKQLDQAKSMLNQPATYWNKKAHTTQETITAEISQLKQAGNNILTAPFKALAESSAPSLDKAITDYPKASTDTISGVTTLKESLTNLENLDSVKTYLTTITSSVTALKSSHEATVAEEAAAAARKAAQQNKWRGGGNKHYHSKPKVIKPPANPNGGGTITGDPLELWCKNQGGTIQNGQCVLKPIYIEQPRMTEQQVIDFVAKRWGKNFVGIGLQACRNAGYDSAGNNGWFSLVAYSAGGPSSVTDKPAAITMEHYDGMYDGNKPWHGWKVYKHICGNHRR